MPWTEALEHAAKDGKALPDGLTLAEKQLYVAMRALYSSYARGDISREEAKREKRLLLNDFRDAELQAKARERSIKTWMWVDLNLNKCECPECLALKKVILGIQNTM